MRKTLAFLTAVLCLSGAGDALAQVRVEGYTRPDGTYVQPHYRTAPNNTPMDNYGTRGNTNPFTGQPGTRDPYATPPAPQRPAYTPPPSQRRF